MYFSPSAYEIKDGTSISVTTSAAQETGLGSGVYVQITNTGSEIAYINTSGETATTSSMPVLIGEKVSPIYLPTGTINHKGAGNTTLVVNELVSVGSI